jgi:glycosyltransferase involved in cell wall biosynthesis
VSTGRALVVSYNFPPHGAVGSLRTLRLVRQLDAEGWEVTVLSGAPATYLPGDAVEPSLVSKIPPAVRVVQQRAVRPITASTQAIRRVAPKQTASNQASVSAAQTEPSRTASSGPVRRLIDLVDTLTSIPDNESGWLAPATVRGLWLCAAWRPDVLYSTAPPWTAEVVGYLLAAFTRTPWVADFRDPWARAPWREAAPPMHVSAWRRLERRVVNRARAVVFNTRTAYDDFASHYGPAVAGKLRVVPNGCDVSEFEGVERIEQQGFVLLHAGSLYGGRNPTPLLEAIDAAIRRGAVDRSQFRLRLLGAADVNLDRTIVQLGLEGVVERRPAVGRRQALSEMRSASALLLIQPGHPLSVPAKTYEYLAAGRPILALTDAGETARVVEESGVGVTAPAGDVVAIEAALLRVMAMAAGPLEPARPDMYDGLERARELVRILSNAVGPTPAGRGRSIEVVERRRDV